MFLARYAYSRVLSVSSKQYTDGDIVAIMHVFVSPPNESLINLVKLLSLVLFQSENLSFVHHAFYYVVEFFA